MQNRYDLIVVGTGFASTFFLCQYLRKAKANSRVLVLERGYQYSHSERRKSMAGEPGEKNPNPEPHEVYVNKNPEKHWAFTVGFGGSSNCWYACTPRFMPSDFKLKSLYGVGMDWPVQYDELEPYYTEVETLMDISGPDETPFPKSKPYPLPPHKFSSVDRILNKTYGPLYISQPTARASQAVKGRSMCCVNAVCSLCPVNAKFTIENSGLNVYEDPRVKVIYGANVTRLDFQGNQARGVSFILDGKDTFKEADVVALGANAIFNAGILLNSGDRHPLTGKGLGEQLGLDVVVHLKDLDNVGGSTWVTANGYMLYDGPHRRDYAACLMESNNAPYLRLESGKWRQVAMFRMIFEDLPLEKNYVAPGVNSLKPETHFNGHSEYAIRGIERMKEKLPAVFASLPVEKIEYLDPFKTEAHILGTTRMANDADQGVVDRNMIHHYYRNLFVLGAGSFTTFSPNNPTLTLSAMSLLAADRSF